ncbi:MAG: bifunctional [glutamate--ammonia ligase]-adenylyl-L-tyrosine phosphorylase/[glutamate--ammonia-ligase] adenylyltransferase [Gammaproteobacteria bacterium]|nr:bifunctional [glutamate--ammonia ligase]-adenylyl-L-tyrosine phosphorylase/[glutamate--ammonia-ligase] adenylyltransferase [Gammaproteobacteria bacterium]
MAAGEVPAKLPQALADVASTRLERLAEAGVSPTLLETLSGELEMLAVGSDFAIDWLAREPSRLQVLLDADLHRSVPSREALAAELQATLEGLGDVDDPAAPDGPVGAALRHFRNHHQVGIIWRDLNRHTDLDGTLCVLSDLAEIILEQTLALLHRRLAADLGEPLDEAGRPEQLVVLALGKLGARELNLSSDVDLMFAYPAPGQTAAGLSNQDWFLRLGRQLIGVLDTRTSAGFVYRVDMRLRPFGDSGPMVQHFDALLGYYEEQGRDWERYAMIKARPVAGDLVAGRALLAGLRPFVFRRYLDFGAIEALREMKALIRREVRRKQLQDNVKLGEGGIREVEFIAQVFQLIHGGRDVRFQQPALRMNLRHIADAGLLDEAEVADLDVAYVYLREVEHRLQAVADEQTQKLPRDALAEARLAWAMGQADAATFTAELTRHRQRVAEIFADLIQPLEADGGGDDDFWAELWAEPDGASSGALAAAGFADPGQALSRLADLRQRREREVTQELGRQRLDALMPRLLALVGEAEDPDRALARSLRLVEAVLRRTAYLVLLVENPKALEQLVRLCQASDWIAETLARHPILVDELLEQRALYTPPQRDGLARELSEHLKSVPAGDLEQQMEQLRYFKEATELRVAACELSDILPIMKVSDALTWLAEVIIEQVVSMAWQHTVTQYGRPRNADGEAVDEGFGVIGYGKVGGIELGWGSDLDLVFLHDLPTDGETDGERSVANGQFFARLGQRIIHLLTTRTHTGELYEVDMRLRPSGQAGVLVSSLAAFARYQREEAWTWEHQALVRARLLAGPAAIAADFAAIRGEILGRERDREALRQDIVSMRLKMLTELRGLRERPPAEQLAGRTALDLKQDPGAVVDIEFMVQYLVLGWAHAHPDLLLHTDAIRSLTTALAEGILPAATAELLIESYKEFRAETHRRTLQNLPAQSDDPELLGRARAVAAVWDEWMGAPS